MKPLLIRADASATIGTGHVMRCLALAQAWVDAGGEAVFAVAEVPPKIEERLVREGMAVERVSSDSGTVADAQRTLSLAKQRGCDWVVVDGYQFSGQYQRELKNAGLKVLVVDDNGDARSYVADLVVNQNAHADERLYADRDRNTRLLLGPKYTMLRREFRQHLEWRRSIAETATKVLVTMGGSDPENLTLRVIEGFNLVAGNLEPAVIVGGGNPHLGSLQSGAERSSKDIRVLTAIDNMAEWMKWADVAVSAAGSTCWEMCFLGLPAALIDIAPNQHPVAHELNDRGAAVHLGSGSEVTAERITDCLSSLLASQPQRAKMSNAGREIVDGEGVARVISAMSHDELCLRPVQPGDAKLLWDWVNDPAVRQASFCQATIPWEQHQKWFASKLGDKNCLMLIAEDRNRTAVGQIRVEWGADGEGEIDVSLANHRRGRGEGSTLIDLGVRKLFASTDTERVHAYIRPENTASMQAFERAKFRRIGLENVKGHAAVHFLRSKNEES